MARHTRALLLLMVLWAVPLQAQEFRTTGQQTLSALGSVELDARSLGTAVVTVTGLTGTVSFEVTNDRQSWVAVDCATPVDPGTAVNSSTAAGVWSCPVAGMRAIRARVSTYTSGVARIEITAAATGGGSGGGGAGGTVTLAPGSTVEAVITNDPLSVTVDNIGPSNNSAYAITPCYRTSTASTNALNCAAAAANYYGIEWAINVTTTPAFITLYNTAGTPTCGTSIIGVPIPIPAASATGVYGGVHLPALLPTHFATGIGMCISAAADGTGNAPVGIQVKLVLK
jgi:hypothetical protein